MGMSRADLTAVPPPIAAEHLPDDLATLKDMILELLATLQERNRDNEALRHRLELLLRRLYGPRSERVDPNQRSLFPEDAPGQDKPAAASTEPAAETTPRRKCRPHGRRRLPEHLPRVLQHHTLSEAERLCSLCGGRRGEIGTEKSEQLDYKPASLFVIEHVVHKYACPCCSKGRRPASSPESEATPDPAPSPQEGEAMPEPTPTPEPGTPSATPPTESTQTQEPMPSATEPAPTPPLTGTVIAAAKPAAPIAKGLPGPGLLAHLIVSKYVDHLPLYRLEHIYERQGLFLPRSTLCDWLTACGQLLRPLYQTLVHRMLRSRALHTDDTPVKLQDPKTHLLSTARLWTYLGDQAHPFNVFDFTLNRRRDGPQQFLAGYQGYLHADAFSGYDGLYLPDPRTTESRIIEVACNAHARRKFYEARTSDALRSHQALAYYRQLYALEGGARDLSDTQRLQMRQELSLPILEQFRVWIDRQRGEVLPKSPMAEALGYALNNWTALVRYTEAGFLAIDNNAAEREMKRIAIGRKNWLFVGSPQGGRTAAVLMSFASTCRRLNVEPWAYLQDVLTRLPATPTERLDELAPDQWQAAQQAKGATPSASDRTVPSPESGS
jgi:transposase